MISEDELPPAPLDRPMMCRCGRSAAADEECPCPYRLDVLDDARPFCRCCESCRQECLYEI